MDFQEIVDVVDVNDNVIGKERIGKLYDRGSCNYRVVNLFIESPEGKLWIPRRAATKSVYPLCLDMSMGGHIRAGETYDEAFKRELFEELRINADEEDWKCLHYLSPFKHQVSAFMKVYHIYSDREPEYNSADFVESYWLEPQEVVNWIEIGEPSKSDLSKLVILCYLGEMLETSITK